MDQENKFKAGKVGDIVLYYDKRKQNIVDRIFFRGSSLKCVGMGIIVDIWAQLFVVKFIALLLM